MFKKILRIKKRNFVFWVIFLLILLEILVWKPFLVWEIGAFSLSSIIFSVWKLLPKSVFFRQEIKRKKNFFSKFILFFKIFLENKNYIFLFSPLLLFLGSVFFIFFQGNFLIIQLAILFFAFLYYLFLKSLFFYFYPDIGNSLNNEEKNEVSKDKFYFMENSFTVVNLALFFLLYSGFFFLISFFNIHLWIIVLFAIFITFVVNYQLFFVYKTSFKMNLFYNIIITLIMVEVFWSVAFLPTGAYVNSMILTSVYYAIIGMLYFHLKDNLDKIKIFRHLAISLTIMIFAIVSAKWF